MSTKKQTTSTNTYNPASMNAFNGLQPQIQSLLQQYMTNPNSVVAPFYNQATQQAQKNAAQLGQSGISNISGNMAASGFGGTNMPAYMASQIATQNRATSGLQSNAFLQGKLGQAGAALGVQQAGLAGAQGYRPLQTGGTQTQSTSGLGTWLPQLAGTAIGAFAGPLGGMFKGSGGGAPAPVGALPTSFWNPIPGLQGPQ